MVLFVDLEDETEPPENVTNHWHNLNQSAFGPSNSAALEDRRVNPNKNATTEALGCYPYVHSVPRSIAGFPCYLKLILIHSQCHHIDSVSYRSQHPRCPFPHLPSSPRQLTSIPHQTPDLHPTLRERACGARPGAHIQIPSPRCRLVFHRRGSRCCWGGKGRGLRSGHGGWL